MTGLFAAEQITAVNARVNVSVYEWGAREVPAPEYLQPAVSSSRYFRSGGLRRQVGGRSNCWGGVVGAVDEAVIRSNIHWRPEWAGLTEEMERLKRLLQASARVQPVGLGSVCNALPGFLPKVRVPKERRRFPTINPARYRLRTDMRVKRIEPGTGDRLRVVTESETIQFDDVVLACGAIEGARLLGTYVSLATGDNVDCVPGLGDHFILGLALRTSQAGAQTLLGLDLQHTNISRAIFIQVHEVTGTSDVLVDVWGWVEVGGSDEGLIFLGSSKPSVHFELSHGDEIRLKGLMQELTQVAGELSELLAVSAREVSVPGAAYDELPHFDDLDIAVCNHWSWYSCVPGEVHHEFAGEGVGRLLERVPGSSVLALGGPAFRSIGSSSPSIGFLAAAAGTMSLL